MAGQPEIIDLCDSGDENDDVASQVPITNQRIPTEPSQAQTPSDAPVPNRTMTSPQLGTSKSPSLERPATTTTQTGQNKENVSNRKMKENDRSALDKPSVHQLITPNEAQSPVASKSARVEAVRVSQQASKSVDKPPKATNAADLERNKTEFLQCHCFACEVPLCHPVRRDVERSCYALHSHPTLKVPVCVVCSDEIANLELTKGEDGNHDDDICGLCGTTSADKMFLCDGSSCRASSVCDECVQRANPTSKLSELEASDDEWYCPCCKPPPVILKLQEYLDKLQESQESISASKETRIDSLLEDLRSVESKKAECEEELEKQEDYKIEIELELTRSGSLPQAELQDQVQEEFDLWLDAQEKHHTRLVDMITILQESLEQEGFDLKPYYEEEFNLPDIAAHEKEQWKIQADEQLQARDNKEKEEMRRNPPPPPPEPREDEPDEEELALEEIDDLGSMSDASDLGEKFYNWRHDLYGVQDWQMKQAMKAEEERFAAALRKPRKVSETQDAQATVSERKKSAVVRKEASIVVEECQRKRHRAQKRPRSNESSGHKPRTSSDNSSRERRSSDIVLKQGAKKSTSFRTVNRDIPLSDSDSDDDYVVQKRSGFGHLFAKSDLILTTDPHQECIRVADALCKILKPHQREGVMFMFQNAFHDIAFPKGKLTEEIEKEVGGCILAHNMGLGKSLCCVALLHTLFFHPSLQNNLGHPTIRFAILVAPVNTIGNWENELSKWTEEIGTPIQVHTLLSGGQRRQVIKSWVKFGGVLLMSDALFRRCSKDCQEELNDRCDVIFLDEAHTMLKNRNATFKALNAVKTKRRICLTGSPFQNNLLEYFRMASYIRPGILGLKEGDFEKNYAKPIESGLSKDATEEEKKKSDETMNEIQAILERYVNRKDASVLLEELPPMQQVVLHTNQTKVQRSLHKAYKQCHNCDGKDFKNFLHMYSSLRPVHNHPGTLLFRESKPKPKEEKAVDPTMALPAKSNDTKPGIVDSSTTPRNEPASNVNKLDTQNIVVKVEPMEMDPKQVATVENKDPNDRTIIELLSDSEEEDPEPEQEQEQEVESESEATPEHWWSSVAEQYSKDEMKKAENGNKVVLLLHILAHACILNEKVVVFSQCLKTLDYISSVLAIKDWVSEVPSLAESFEGISIGGWKPGKDFLRIDGATSASDRGDRVNRFEDDSIRLFLISSRAGGIGINLCSANRVVLFDSHFNPTVDLQALYRCYRYGQKRSVFAYRFLTEGTTEGKVYSRAVNKSSLALSLVDGKSFQRLFTAKETEDIAKTDKWVECSTCKKWRMFPPQENIDESALPEEWYCAMMNDVDKSTKIDCKTPEMDELQYWKHFGITSETKESKSSSGAIVAVAGSAQSLSEDMKKALVARDVILESLLDVSGKKSKKKVVSRYYFHDALIDKEKINKSPTTDEVEPSDQIRAKKAKVAPEDTTATRFERSDRIQPTRSSPRKSSKEKSIVQQRSEEKSNKKRPPPQSSKPTNQKRTRRKLDFRSLFSGFD